MDTELNIMLKRKKMKNMQVNLLMIKGMEKELFIGKMVHRDKLNMIWERKFNLKQNGFEKS